MTLTQLHYLVAIVDAGLHITLAADAVHATQSGISKQLKQLEGELGFRIFVRRGRSLESVTPAGTQVIERARVILAEARNIRALAANQRNEGRGDLTLATTHTQARFVMPDAIARLQQHYPELGIHIRTHSEQDVLGLFENGAVDLAMVSTSGAVPAGGLAVPLFHWRRAVVAPREHPLALVGRPLALADLADCPLVSYESSLRPESSLRRAFHEAGLEPRLACTSSDADLIKAYVRAGLGIGILAEMALGEQDEHDLAVLDAALLLPQCTTWLVLREDRVLRRYTAMLAELLAPQISQADLQRAIAGDAPGDRWPEAPSWSELRKRGPKLVVQAA